jgi:hypothetical protein
MSLWVGQDGTMNDDEGDGAAAPGSEGGYDDASGADDTAADAGDVGDAGDAGDVQADEGGDGDVVETEEADDVDDTQPLASVYDSVTVFEPSMYYPGEVVLFGGVPHFTRRYFERIGAMPRRRRRHRRFGMEREAPRLSFWEKIFGRRHHRPHVEREVAFPRHHAHWERELIELRRLYPGREREFLEFHRLYPGREREMMEMHVRREREHRDHLRRTVHPAHPAHPDHPAHPHKHDDHKEKPAHPGHPGHPAHQPPTAAQAQAPHAVHPAQQAAAQQRGARVPMAPSALQPQQKPVVQPAKGAQVQAQPHPLPPSPELQMQQQVLLGEHATSGTFTGWDYPLTDYNGYLFVDGPGQYWLWTITEPWMPPMNPPNYVPELFPPPPPPDMLAAMDLSPWEISRSNLFMPDEEIPEDAQPHITGVDFPFTDYYGNLILDALPMGSGQMASMLEDPNAPHFVGNGSLPMTDHWGNLLTAPHPFHIDYPWPPTMGGPVLTGFDTPFTDLYGRLLTNYGQYGNFTVENPWDWSNWDDVDLDRIDTEGDPQWFVVGQDDLGASLGSAFGSALGSATGDTSGSFGQAGKEIGSSIESGASSGDWGSALASIGTSVAKAALPALAKAGTDALAKATSQGGGGAQQQGGSSQSISDVLSSMKTTQQAPQQRSSHAQRGAPADARNAMRSLVRQMTTLGQKYGIQRPGRTPRTQPAAPSGGA